MIKKSIIAICIALSACGGGGDPVIGNAQAQEPPAQPVPYYPGGTNVIQQIANIIDGQFKAVKYFVSTQVGYLSAAVVGLSQCDTNGVGCTPVGGYFAAECVGKPGGKQDECVGVYARVDCGDAYWCVASHAEAYDTRPDNAGGTFIGQNIELKGSTNNPGRIGINLQPDPKSRGLTGFNFQYPEAYSYAINLNGAPLRLGEHNGVPICLGLVEGKLDVSPCKE
jgi:hypothetical protein